MKKAVYLICLIVFAAGMAGCSSTDAYFVDRGRDAADIITASWGFGGGVKARVGALQVGLFANTEKGGLRAGNAELLFPIKPRYDTFDVDFFLVPVFGTFGFEKFESNNKVVVERHKDIQAAKRVPFVSLTSREYAHYYTAVEVAVGLGGTLRLGFNAGELIDFIL